ncbi:MAG TPA: AbrB/MazE/SpoVT family DNA-binding domain-containing protein [Candidatus Thermoplasmatota archaeon]|nr:AbrB/MazE/SpoVT family DNA-binding domain-containing protein [Candidatus Thermoplasmatota archaeon]
MAELTVVPKRIGGSLAVFLPAEVVQREGIVEGRPVRIRVQRDLRPSPLGLLKGKVGYEAFDRRKEGFWPAE